MRSIIKGMRNSYYGEGGVSLRVKIPEGDADTQTVLVM